MLRLEPKTKKFIKLVESESKYRKFLKRDIIYHLVDIFKTAITTKKTYQNQILNPLELGLTFYKEFNGKYYDLIMNGISKGRIIVNDDLVKSYTDTANNKTYIKLNGDDNDLFIVVHELAHFIDRNSNPKIIPDEYWFFSETWAFYLEKQLEKWLLKKDYHAIKELINIRENNRIYFESEMLKAISYELYYEDLYRENGTIPESSIDIAKIALVMKYDISNNIVNYLLQYPLANVLASYLANNSILKDDYKLINECLNIDLYALLDGLEIIEKENAYGLLKVK